MTGKNQIGFSFSSLGKHSFRAIDPSTNQFLDVDFFNATSDEVNRAVHLAKESLHLFSRSSIIDRVNFLLAIADELRSIEDAILERYMLESGLSQSRGRSEFERTLFQLVSFANALREGDVLGLSIDLADNERVPPKPDIRKMNIAIGPVVVFGASNFPLAYSTAGGDTASAFAAGCPVIVKAHPMHPGTSSIVAEAIMRSVQKCGLPEGVFSHLLDDGFAVGQDLVKHPDIKAVGFTGSYKGGMALYRLALERTEPIPVFAEMGSINPIIVMQAVLSGETHHIAEMISRSVTNDCGQFCTKPGIILLPEGVEADNFRDQLMSQIKTSVPGTMLGPSLLKAYKEGVQRVFEKTGASVKISEDAIANKGIPAVLEILQDDLLEDDKYVAEIFGPFTMIIRFKDITGLFECLDVLKGQLTCSVFAAKEELSGELFYRMHEIAGRVIVNGVPTGVTVCDSMHHGGPFPATTDSRFTAVGADSIKRFMRPVAFQNCPHEHLPEVLGDKNPLLLNRRVNGVMCKTDIVHKKD